MSRDEFTANRTLQLALAYLIQIIGEAAREVSPSVIERLPDVPWPEIRGMRHRLVHDYSNVSFDLAYGTSPRMTCRT